MGKKRRATEQAGGGGADKKAKTRKSWQTTRQQTTREAVANVEPGDAGIWVTCDMGKKGRCARELLDLFEEYAARMYQPPASSSRGDDAGSDTAADAGAGADASDSAPVDIEAAIQRELRGLGEGATTATVASTDTEPPLFSLVKGDTECLMFFKTRSPVEPVSFVHAICSDAATATSRKRSRFVKRLTPMTLMGRASEKGLDEVAQLVLAPAFHQPGEPAKKFAIRPTLRNHSILSRDAVIQRVAAAVGPGHSVDLQDYDALILVDLYKNVCGLSVVGRDYDKLKRYNLAELFEPTPRPEAN